MKHKGGVEPRDGAMSMCLGGERLKGPMGYASLLLGKLLVKEDVRSNAGKRKPRLGDHIHKFKTARRQYGEARKVHSEKGKKNQEKKDFCSLNGGERGNIAKNRFVERRMVRGGQSLKGSKEGKGEDRFIESSWGLRVGAWGGRKNPFL